jgi:hypothetical protein
MSTIDGTVTSVPKIYRTAGRAGLSFILTTDETDRLVVDCCAVDSVEFTARLEEFRRGVRVGDRVVVDGVVVQRSDVRSGARRLEVSCGDVPVVVWSAVAVAA